MAGRGSPLARSSQLLLQLHPRLRPAGHACPEALEDNKMDKNTIVVFNADHGELGGHHQMRAKATAPTRNRTTSR